MPRMNYGLSGGSYDHGRRLRTFHVSPEFLVDYFQGGLAYRVDRGLPEGARIVGVIWDDQRHCFAFAVEHESFDEVEIGAVLPIAEPPMVTRIETAVPELESA